MPTATGTFEIERRPGPAEGDGVLARHDFTKKFTGGIEGTSVGLMISAGNPASGAAGYVAMEVITGQLDGRRGSFALQQYGTMSASEQRLEYEVVHGSGKGELEGIVGRLDLRVEGGIHHYALEYDL